MQTATTGKKTESVAIPEPGGLAALPPFDFQPRTRVIFGAGSLASLGSVVQDLGGRRVLLVTDPGLKQIGVSEAAAEVLRAAGIAVHVFDQVPQNPTTADVDRCTEFARPWKADLLVGLGGGSSLDCAKGANFLLTNGGRMHDYRGTGKATKPMLPMIAVPTTSGTGSEAQSYAVIADAETHMKMACGDPKATCRVAILDPELTVTMPEFVTAATGIDAMTHALESYVTTRRNPISQMYARQAWELLSGAFPAVLNQPGSIEARGRMQLGAFLAGMAIETSMLGAAHAAANPLTAQFGTVHGVAVGLLMPPVIRWNASAVPDLYRDLARTAGWVKVAGDSRSDAEVLADGFTELRQRSRLPGTLTEVNGSRPDNAVIEKLAADAVNQWTGTFNPRRMDRTAFVRLSREIL